MLKKIVSDIIDSNVFIVGDEAHCIIIDAGATLEKVKSAVGDRKVEVVFLTHGHYDHCFYATDYARAFGCKIFCSEFAKEYLEDEKKNYAKADFSIKDFSNFNFLSGEGTLSFGDIKVEFKTLGGHSKSDTIYQIGDDLFVGDILIGRDMGRLDLYGGDKDQMKESFQELLSKNYLTMHSGHGEDNPKQKQDIVIETWLKFLKR